MTLWEKLDKIKWKLGIIVGIIVAIGFLTRFMYNNVITPISDAIDFQTEVRTYFGELRQDVKNLSERNRVNSGIDQANMIRFGDIEFIAYVNIINGENDIVDQIETPLKVFVARSEDLYGWVVDKGINEGESVYAVDYQNSERRFRYMDFNGKVTWVDPSLTPDEYKKLLEEALAKYGK